MSIRPRSMSRLSVRDSSGCFDAMETNCGQAFERTSPIEFREPVLKMGRTQLQDAVPMTLGQEFRRLRR